MPPMKGWRDRQEAARLRNQHVRVDPEIRKQRAKALEAAKAATNRASQVYDEAPTAASIADLIGEDEENSGALMEGDDEPAQPFNGDPTQGVETVSQPTQTDEPVVAETVDNDAVATETVAVETEQTAAPRPGKGKRRQPTQDDAGALENE